MTDDAALNSKTVLIVDDTPGNLAVLSDMLSEYGYRVLVATDGQSAIEQISFLKPDIILLDVMMPGIDGFETCRRLKNDHATQHIPIIFMTGLSELNDLLKGFEEGAVDYIVKPIRPPEVLARVEAQLQQVQNSKRIENTLSHIGFSALAFAASGLITWMPENSKKIIDQCYPTQDLTIESDSTALYLPKLLLNQLIPIIKAGLTEQNEVKLNNDYSGKIIPCHQNNEYMLLIQKTATDWDLASLKSSFGLTARQAEILMWISRGKTNKEVGLILETSPRTVNKHLEHIFAKLEVATRTAAVAKVMKK